jgi:ADP-heptose:LPS heptosyltransferase
MDDHELKEIKYIVFDYFQEVGNIFTMLEFAPFLRPFFSNKLNEFKQVQKRLEDYIMERYISHLEYQEGNDQDFCDTLITAKNDAIREQKESAPYLTDKNLAFAVFDLFAGKKMRKMVFQFV